MNERMIRTTKITGKNEREYSTSNGSRAASPCCAARGFANSQ